MARAPSFRTTIARSRSIAKERPSCRSSPVSGRARYGSACPDASRATAPVTTPAATSSHPSAGGGSARTSSRPAASRSREPPTTSPSLRGRSLLIDRSRSATTTAMIDKRQDRRRATSGEPDEPALALAPPLRSLLRRLCRRRLPVCQHRLARSQRFIQPPPGRVDGRRLEALVAGLRPLGDRADGHDELV